jgi:RNA polymerase sigma-70 factor (ECF subfamily)
LRRRKIIECGISETREIAKYSATRDHSQQADPERTTAQREICRLTEIAIDALPEQFRIVIVARGIEGMSVAETAELLGLKAETVKTRLHRARALLRSKLASDLGPSFLDTFPFAGERCARLTAKVLSTMVIAEISIERLPKSSRSLRASTLD